MFPSLELRGAGRGLLRVERGVQKVGAGPTLEQVVSVDGDEAVAVSETEQDVVAVIGARGRIDVGTSLEAITVRASR